MKYSLIVLVPTLVLGAACASSSPLSSARQDLKGTWSSNDYQVAKAEQWAADKPTTSPKGIAPSSKEQCYSSGASSQGIPGKRCYRFIGAKLFSRTRTFRVPGPRAVELFQGLATELKARVFSFEHGPIGRSDSLKCARTGSKERYEPYLAGGKIVQLGTPTAESARDAGVLCAWGDATAQEWVSLAPMPDGTYAVVYTQITSNMEAHGENDRYQKASEEHLNRKMREIVDDLNLPVTEAGSAAVIGSLDRTVVQKVIRQNLGGIKRCYSSALQKDHRLAGKMRLKFTILPTGNVSQASVNSELLAGETKLLKCITGKVSTWQFPQPKGGGIVKVSYPVILRSK